MFKCTYIFIYLYIFLFQALQGSAENHSHNHNAESYNHTYDHDTDHEHSSSKVPLHEHVVILRSFTLLVGFYFFLNVEYLLRKFTAKRRQKKNKKVCCNFLHLYLCI